MKIVCTVEEFGKLVRGCEKLGCYNCPLNDICGDSDGKIEKFITAADVVEEAEEK